MNWNWDPRTWRTATRLLLGLVTIWPIIYIGLFVGVIFSGIMFGVLSHREPDHTDLDLIQLEKKIQNGDIKELRIKSGEIIAIDRKGRSFETYHVSESTRDEIIRQAQQLDSDHRPRVERIEQNSSRPGVERLLPFGFMLLFVMHFLTIVLMFLLMPFYMVLALHDQRHDQNTRIIWIVLVATLGIVANPVYWYLYVWRKTKLPSGPLSNPS